MPLLRFSRSGFTRSEAKKLSIADERNPRLLAAFFISRKRNYVFLLLGPFLAGAFFLAEKRKSV